MNILVTNDDGYLAKGIHILAEMMRRFGDVYVVAPKTHQSGMSMAVSLGFKAIRYKKICHMDRETASDGSVLKGSIDTSYLDATPASCVKFALDSEVFDGPFPDIVVSGINHGSNAASASCYSGTLGAAREAALCGVPAIGVSLSSMDADADFSAVEKYFPDLFSRLLEAVSAEREKNGGVYYNINFPDIHAALIRGVRTGHQGKGHWIKEFIDWDPDYYAKYGVTPEMLGQESSPDCEDGEKLYMMVGTFVDDSGDDTRADHHIMRDGYISIVAHNIDTTDCRETERLESMGFDIDF